MIIGLLHPGSGLGNQLHRYVMTRVLALDKNLQWGMANTGAFKGYSFLNLDMGEEIPFPMVIEFPAGKTVVNCNFPIYQEKSADYDWEGLLTVRDNMIIDGDFQGEKYYEHWKPLISRWLAVEPLDLSDNLCVIGFRGGEYSIFPELFLPQEYWDRAIAKMLEINPNMTFKVVTDDPETARKFFPNFEITHDIGRDWRHIRYAKYLILANSSFYILPAWLNENVKHVIAPWGWARHNLGRWSMEQNKMKGWNYLDKDGTYETFS